MIEGKQAFNEFRYGVQLAASEVTGAGLTWGTNTLVLTGDTNSISATTQSVVGPAAGAPVAAIIKYVQIQTKGINGTWELSSSTNTKAFVVANSSAIATLPFVVGATSILNVALAAGEVLYINSTTAAATATVIVGLHTAN